MSLAPQKKKYVAPSVSKLDLTKKDLFMAGGCKSPTVQNNDGIEAEDACAAFAFCSIGDEGS